MAWGNFTELTVWNKSMELTDEIYRLIRLLPDEERFCLKDQLRRAVVSIPSNIAEGHGRENAREFRRFILIAKGSQAEVETQLYICVRQHYLTKTDIEAAISLCHEIGSMCMSLARKLNLADA